MSINPGKYKKYQDRRAWPQELLSKRYKAEDCGMGERRAITIELQRRKGSFKRSVPQRRQAIVNYLKFSAHNHQKILESSHAKLVNLYQEADDVQKGIIRFYVEQLRMRSRENAIFLADIKHFQDNHLSPDGEDYVQARS